MTASAPSRLGTIVAAIAVILGAGLAVLVAVRLDLGCSSDASDAIQNVACDPRTGALDILRVIFLGLAPAAAVVGAVAALARGQRRPLALGAGLALMLVMAAGDVGGAQTPDAAVPRIDRMAAERSGQSVALDLSLTGEALVLLDFGSAERRPRAVSESGRPADPRVAGGFGPGYLLGPGRHRLRIDAPARGQVVRAEAILPGDGNQRDRSRGVVQARIR